MAKQHYLFQERARVKIDPRVSLREAMTELLLAIPQGFRRRPCRMRYRLPAHLRQQLIEELAPGYRNSYFGDLEAEFRRCAELYWGMTYAGIDVHLDDSLTDVIAIDTPTAEGHTAKKMPELTTA